MERAQLKNLKWCIVCGRLINPLSLRRTTCGTYCRGRYKCGETPYINGPKKNTVAEVAVLAANAGLSYGMYTAHKEKPVRIRNCEVEEKTAAKELIDMPIYVHCPFYKNDRGLKLNCEGCSIKFPDSTARSNFMNTRCANEKLWTKCSIAECLKEYYERED